MQHYALQPVGQCCNILLTIATNGLWSVIIYIYNPWQNSIGEKFQSHEICQVPPIQYCCTTTPYWTSFYWESNQVKGLIVWYVIMPIIHTFSYMQQSSPKADVRCIYLQIQGFSYIPKFYAGIFFSYLLTLSYRSWCIPFHNQSAFTDMNFHNGFYTSAVTVENVCR